MHLLIPQSAITHGKIRFKIYNGQACLKSIQVSPFLWNNYELFCKFFAVSICNIWRFDLIKEKLQYQNSGVLHHFAHIYFCNTFHILFASLKQQITK